MQCLSWLPSPSSSALLAAHPLKQTSQPEARNVCIAGMTTIRRWRQQRQEASWRPNKHKALLQTRLLR